MAGDRVGSAAKWLAFAQRDLDRVRRSLRDGDAEAGGLFLQQAVEKAIKAFLISHGTKPRRTHDLEALLEDGLRHEPSLEGFRELCQRASAFYIPTRYPDSDLPPPTLDELRSAMDQLETLVARMNELLSAQR